VPVDDGLVPVFYQQLETGEWEPLPDELNRIIEHGWRAKATELRLPATSERPGGAMVLIGSAAAMAGKFGIALVELVENRVSSTVAVRRGDPNNSSRGSGSGSSGADSGRDRAGSGPAHEPISQRAVERSVRLCSKFCTELISSERTYLQALDAIANVFKKPLVAWAADLDKESPGGYDADRTGTVSRDELALVFGEVDTILSVTTQLLHSLQAAKMRCDTNAAAADGGYGAGGCPAALAAVLGLAAQQGLRLYSPHLKEFTQANTLLGQIRNKARRPRFFDAVRILELQPGGGRKNTLPALIVQVVQRLPRYVMLLRDIRKEVVLLERAAALDVPVLPDPAQCGDVENAVHYARLRPGTVGALDDAIQRLHKVTLGVEAVEKDAESRSWVMAFAIEVGCSELAIPSRRMLKEGAATKFRRSSKTKVHRSSRQLVLFNDMLVVYNGAKKGNSGSLYYFPLSLLVAVSATAACWRGSLTFERCWHLEPMAQVLAAFNIEQAAFPADEQRRALVVGIKNDGFILLQMKSAAECDEWTDAILKAAAEFSAELGKDMANESRRAQCEERVQALERKPANKVVAAASEDAELALAMGTIVASVRECTSDTPHSTPPPAAAATTASSGGSGGGGGGGGGGGASIYDDGDAMYGAMATAQDVQTFLSVTHADRSTAEPFLREQLRQGFSLADVIAQWFSRRSVAGLGGGSASA
jgi:uncharacterized membrane protein YgcG